MTTRTQEAVYRLIVEEAELRLLHAHPQGRPRNAQFNSIPPPPPPPPPPLFKGSNASLSIKKVVYDPYIYDPLFYDAHSSKYYYDGTEKTAPPSQGKSIVHSLQKKEDVEDNKVYKTVADQDAADSIEFVKNALQRSETLTSSMVEILESFEDRLAELESSILPIHRLTQRLRTMNVNMESTNAAISKIMDIFATAKQVENLLKQDSDTKDMDAHLEALDRVSEAMNFLQRNRSFKSSDAAFARLRALSHSALAAVEKSFLDHLSQASMPLDATGMEELKKDPFLDHRKRSRKGNEDVPPLGTLDSYFLVPSAHMDEMRKLVKPLRGFKQSRYLREYREKRIGFLSTVMRKLQPERMAESSKGIAVFKYDPGSHPFIQWIRILVRLLQSERTLATELLDPEEFNHTFSEVIGPTFEFFLEISETVMRTKRDTERPFGIFVLLDMWETAQFSLKDMDQALEGTPYAEPLRNLLSRLTRMLRSSFEQFTEEVISTSNKQVPSDASVHEITTVVLNYIRLLHDYGFLDTLHQLLPQNPSEFRNPGVKNGFADWVLTTLTDLREGLLQRARKKDTKKSALIRIFVLNNLMYMLNAIRSSSLLGVLGLQSVSNLSKSIDLQLAAYQHDTWESKLIPLLQEGLGPESIKKKDLKQKLKHFNEELERSYRAQRALSVPNQELRTRIRSMCKETIVPVYKDFLDRYEKVSYYPQIAKYVKYSAETLMEMLDQFCEGHDLSTATPSTSKKSRLRTPSVSSEKKKFHRTKSKLFRKKELLQESRSAKKLSRTQSARFVRKPSIDDT